MAILVLAAALRLQDAEEVSRLAAALGGDAVEERDRAQARLLEIGEPALPALRTIAEGFEAEARLRARLLIEEIERRAFERRHDEAERRRVFRDPLPVTEGRPFAGQPCARIDGAIVYFDRRPYKEDTVALTRAHVQVVLDYQIVRATNSSGTELPLEQ